jgi:hypothetical protein
LPEFFGGAGGNDCRRASALRSRSSRPATAERVPNGMAVSLHSFRLIKETITDGLPLREPGPDPYSVTVVASPPF